VVNKIRLVLAGDRGSFLSCLQSLMLSQEQFTLVDCIYSEIALKECLSARTVDVILFDETSKELCLLEALRRSRCSASKVLLVNVALCAFSVRRWVQRGFRNVLTKDSEFPEICSALQSVFRQKIHLSESVAKKLAELPLMGGDDQDVFSRLSAREWQTTRAISRGYSVREIAQRFAVSPKTVQTYRYRIYNKLNVDSDVQLTLLTQKSNLVPGDDIQ